MNTDKKNSKLADDGKDKKSVISARHEAEADIDKDPDMELPTKEDDLDEGELANLRGDETT